MEKSEEEKLQLVHMYEGWCLTNDAPFCNSEAYNVEFVLDFYRCGNFLFLELWFDVLHYICANSLNQ